MRILEGEPSLDDIIHLHLECYHCHPSNCSLCLQWSALFIVELDTGGYIIIHQEHLHNLSEDPS